MSGIVADDVEPRAAGTCRPGRAEAPAAVVDQHPNVRGTENPRIADASVPVSATTGLRNPTAVAVDTVAVG